MKTRPVIRVHPRQAARLKSGSPWVYSNEITMDRNTKLLTPGSLVNVIGEQGNQFGTAYFNPHSLIAARILTAAPDAEIGVDFFAARLQAARTMRDRLIGIPWYRLIHADADGCPGLVIDRFDDVFVAQSGTTGMDALEPFWLEALKAEFRPRAIFIKNDAPSRAHEGLKEQVRCAHGDETALAIVEENGVRHEFSPLAGQKTGWYFDQRDNREFLVRYAQDRSVLDAFSYTGALALAASKKGARNVLMLDASQAALDQAVETARLNTIDGRIEARRCDAMVELEEMGPAGELFDIVSCDPPTQRPGIWRARLPQARTPLRQPRCTGRLALHRLMQPRDIPRTLPAGMRHRHCTCCANSAPDPQCRRGAGSSDSSYASGNSLSKIAGLPSGMRASCHCAC